jgi:hypothetical protein
MDTPQRVVSGNRWSKVVFGLTTVLLVFAPLTARPGGAAEATPRNPLGLTVCRGYFALCAASTCTPIPNKKIAVNTLTGRPAYFPQADCTCPVILGQSLADLAGAICKVLVSHRDWVNSGRNIRSERTFRRRSPTGFHTSQRTLHRRRSARRASISEISMRNVTAWPAMTRPTSTMCR